MNADFAAARPNAGHRGLVRLAEEGRLHAVITQNIDGLHQRAGLPAELLIEIHGNSTHGHCLDCRAEMSLAEVREIIDATGAGPRCACGGLVKAAVVSFGERLRERDLLRAAKLAAEADLFLVVGSSLQVQPAASLPLRRAAPGHAWSLSTGMRRPSIRPPTSSSAGLSARFSPPSIHSLLTSARASDDCVKIKCG